MKPLTTAIVRSCRLASTWRSLSRSSKVRPIRSPWNMKAWVMEELLKRREKEELWEGRISLRSTWAGERQTDIRRKEALLHCLSLHTVQHLSGRPDGRTKNHTEKIETNSAGDIPRFFLTFLLLPLKRIVFRLPLSCVCLFHLVSLCLYEALGGRHSSSFKLVPISVTKGEKNIGLAIHCAIHGRAD